jgi:polysaccharide pyruvyl transferase WcaK-like protein
MTIAQFGTFDVGNYGDLLFPLIARWRCPEFEWIHVSPIGGPTGFSDSASTIGFAEAMDARFDAVLVGGGNILSSARTRLAEYAAARDTAYPSLWAGAACLASERKVPLIINAPSIMTKDPTPLERALLKAVFESSAYAAVRDGYSARIVASATRAEGPAVVPDTAFDIDSLWPARDRAAAPSPRYFVAHVNKRYMKSEAETARALDSIAYRLEAEARLLPIGPCHGDVQLSRAVAAEMAAPRGTCEAKSLRDMAREIAGASLYVGSSMHGMITALCYGVPCLLVLRGDTPMRKFIGALDASGCGSDMVCDDWSRVEISLAAARVMDAEARARVKAGLDAHWERVRREASFGAPCRIPSWLNHWRPLLRISRTVVARLAMKAVRR